MANLFRPNTRLHRVVLIHVPFGDDDDDDEMKD